MRLILDNNLWSYVGQTGSKDDLERFASSQGVTICTPPATLLEVLANNNKQHRDRVVAPMTSPLWRRLRTEVDRECEEIISEAKRVRPEWVLQFPKPDRPASLRTFWTKQIWRQAAQDSDPLAALRPDVMDAASRAAFDNLKTNSLEARRNSWKAGGLEHVMVTLDADAPAEFLEGYAGKRAISPWRLDGRDVYRHQLQRPWQGNTFTDWLAPYLNLNLVTSDWRDFTKFWFEDVTANNMPRNWIRGMTHLAMLESKVTPSSPADGQLATYLMDCDLLLSEDKRFVAAVKRVRAAADFDIPVIERVAVPDATKITQVIASAVEQHWQNATHHPR